MALTFQFLSIVQFFQIICWKDVIEITIFSTIIYFFSYWLAADHTKNLVPILYSYIACTFCAWFFNFYSLSTIFLAYGPVAVFVLILIHQETLQRNYITLKRIIPPETPSKKDWIQIFVRVCLHASSKQKSVKAIIEHYDALESLVQAPFVLKTPVDQSVLSLLIESPSYNQNEMMWITHDGTLIGINCMWHKKPHDDWISEQIKQLDDPWIACAVAYTTKSDALACICSGQTGLFTIIAQGKVVSNLTGARALGIMKKYLHISDQSTRKKGEQRNDAQYIQKSFIDQLHS